MSEIAAGYDSRPLLSLALPVPPSANSLWRNVNGLVLLSKPARIYRKTVLEIVLLRGATGIRLPLTGRLRLTIALTQANRIRRDLDNCIKPIQDALTHAGIWLDDEQIDVLTVHRRAPDPKYSGAHVEIFELRCPCR